MIWTNACDNTKPLMIFAYHRKILFLARCWLCCECNDTADASGNTVTGEKFSVNLVAVWLQGECQQDYIWINRFESCLV